MSRPYWPWQARLADKAYNLPMARGSGILLSDNLFGCKPGATAVVGFQDGMVTTVHEPAEHELPSLLQLPVGDILDFRGKLVLPGLIDAHLHAIPTGMMMLDGSVRGVSSREELRAKIDDAAADGREFIRLIGLDSSRFDPADLASLDRAWLDDVLGDRPLFLKSVEGHSGWFNTLAWKRMGVDAVLKDLKLLQDVRNEMHASGRVYGNSYEHLTTPIYDSYTFDERREGMELVIAEAKRVGLTGLHCMEGYGDSRRHDFELMLELDRRDDIDLVLYCRDDTPQTAYELGVPRFGGCWCADGAIGAHSAALAEPYADKPESDGELYFNDGELADWIEAGLKLDMQVTVHAIGERALDQCLRIYEGFAGKYNLDRLRPRVDHYVMGTAELAQRGAVLGICSAMQPAFDAYWGGTESGYAQRLGPQRALRSNPLKLMQDNGLKIAGSSDCYITPLDPLGGIRAAMNHHNPAMRLDFEAAVNLFSKDAAYLARQESDRGRIAPGYQADFTAVDGERDLAPDAAVSATIKLGKVVHRAP